MKPLLRAIAILLACVLPAGAQELRLGYRTEPTSLDPHYHNATPSSQVAAHIFDALVTPSGTDRLDPGLATDWKTVDPTTWEFSLRRGVHFGDGTPFVADDVVFSYQRVRTVPTPMGGFVNYLGPVASVEAVDDNTLRVHTTQPTPLLPNYLSRIFILSRHIHENAATETFNSGKSLVGTGPYRLAIANGMTNLTLERKPDYWASRRSGRA
jgi:peptide/nickel transport system substrate-binding protein